MQVQIAIHNHRHGTSVYHFVFEDDNHPPISEEYVLENEDVDFEPDRDEDITVLDPITIKGVFFDKLSRVKAEAYGQEYTLSRLISVLSEEELSEAFSQLAEDLAQEGRI